ncbi:PucR family transcriptional regulator [Nocardioides sp.]|uniref:PucR family transcriptional regulator n=1 Tax=Nocardioides sp. TaxID=35761 RepID=UPI003514B151
MQTQRPEGLSNWMTGFLLTETRPDKLQEWTDHTTDAILQEMPELARSPRLTKVLHGAVEQHWLAFLQNFSHPDFHFRLVEEGYLLATEVANAGLPLEVIIKIYRVAQQNVWAYVTQAVNQISPEVCSQSDALIYFWSRAGAWIDESIEASTDIFQATRVKEGASPELRQLAAVRDVLAGEVPDPRRVSALLGGYPLSVRQVAVVLSCSQSEPERLERVALRAVDAVGASRHLLVHPGRGLAWLWLPGNFDVRRLSDAVSAADDDVPVHLAVGVPADGLAGFISSHADAQSTHDIALRRASGPGRPTVTYYEEIELSSLLPCDRRVDRFMHRILGQLAETEGSTERLRETISAYLAQGRNVDEAAALLCVHRNTVRYRLAQAEEMLGSSIAKLGTDLEVALRHFELFHAQQ